MATPEDNERMAREAYEAWNRRDFAASVATVADDAELVVVGSSQTFHGPEGFSEADRTWADAFPDGRIEVDNVVAAGDQVVAELTGRGTHTGSLRTPEGDIPPTGRHATLHMCEVLTFRDGKLRSSRQYFDSVSLLSQLGLMPEPEAAAKA